MLSKWKKWGLLLFSALFGLVVGVYQPLVTQRMLSFLGVIAGLGYFFLSQTGRNRKENAKEMNYSFWFFLIRMLLAFIIGGAIGAVIPYMIMIYRS